MIKKNGFTLIETLLSLSIAILISLGAIQFIAGVKEKELNKKFANEIAAMLYATDRRLFIDSFKDNNFKEQIQSEFPDNIKKAFISTDHSCGNSEGWSPLSYTDIALIPCNLWNRKLPYDLNMKVTIKEKNKNVTKVYYDYSFKSSEKFGKFKGLLLKLNEDIKSNLIPLHAGNINSYFINENNKKISKIDCVRKKELCTLRTEFKSTPMLLLQNDML